MSSIPTVLRRVNSTMAKKSISSSWLLLSLFVALTGTCSSKEGEKKIYIVYLGNLPQDGNSASSVHMNMLNQVGSIAGPPTLLYTYKRSLNGFVAMLSEEEMRKLKDMEGVVSVFPSEMKKVHTTHSWDFMGFPQSVKRSTVESDVVVGVLDTGIWPESRSFSDDGFGPPPKKWKGSCIGLNFTCNNKIIGARYYRLDGRISEREIESPRDSQGHGTHTSSTAAGREVSAANMFGLATGTARGAIPSSRIAVYKVCWEIGCSDADILAAFDDAIADGVDIISLSVGGMFPQHYFEDSIAIGAFHAMKNGILTSTSAGNLGPRPATITNFSPWSLSVAASTIDRKFVTMLSLGNGMVLEGISLNTFTFEKKEYPLIYGGDAPSKGHDPLDSRSCVADSLDKDLVAGKVVLCDTVRVVAIEASVAAASAGAIGIVLADDFYSPDTAYSFPIPAIVISAADGENILKYIKSSRNATANILKSVESKNLLSPFVVSFTSRGPNPYTSGILKPDLTAPGVDILAAWSLATTVTRREADKRVVSYNIISGTSMACPHATGAAAYVKSFHPKWSPAALKSALMTSANSMSVATNNDAEFAYMDQVMLTL